VPQTAHLEHALSALYAPLPFACNAAGLLPVLARPIGRGWC